MLSPIVGPSQGSYDAVADLRSLLTTSPKSYDDWLKSPITRLILSALDESARGRAPQPGLAITDYAQAVGEVVGLQRAVIALKDPEAFLGHLGLGTGPEPKALPKPSYMAPEPPPETTGEKKE